MFKKVKTLMACLIILMQCANAQNVYTVNNTPGATANYHTLQGAIDSVPAGSILLLQPSSQSYLQAILRKPLIIYGAGYFIGQNDAPFTQAKPGESILSDINFFNGSQGTIVSGLSFVTSPNDAPGLRTRLGFDSTSNINISRCKILHANCGCTDHNITAFIGKSSNITVQQCYIDVEGSILAPYVASGVVFKNNIIVGDLNPVSYSQTPFDFSFTGNSMNGRISSINFAGGSFANNVIIQSPTEGVFIGAPMGFADHNVSNVAIFPGGGTNITNADGPNTYVGFSNPAIGSQDGIWQLKPGSVAIGYGPGGIDCGAYGGTSSYVLSGIPAIPNIYFADVPQVGTSTGGLKIHLKIKANN